MRIPLAVQLYTMREMTSKDMQGALRAVAKAGYDGVELAGYGSLKTPAEFAKALADSGLKVAGAHVGLDGLDKELNRLMDEAELLGNKFLVSGLPPAKLKTPEDCRAAAAIYQRAAAAMAPRGFQFAYHNHNWELEKIGEKTPHQIMAEASDPKLLHWELDVYWTKFAGLDPVEYLKQQAGRVLLLHMKDMAAGPERKFAEVGAGILDFKAIVAEGRKAGVPWMIVEQDFTYGRPVEESIKMSYENLRKLGA